MNVCPATASLKVLGPDGFTVKTPGPAGGTMGGCGCSCATARPTHPTMPNTTQSFIWLSGYASSSVYGDRTCSDSLPQVSTDTPNAFCNVKPTRDTALLSPAM